MAANPSKSSDCSPSLHALSGSGCTSTKRPSAPAATPMRASAGTSSRCPAAWLGSAMTGRCVTCLSSAIAGGVEGVAHRRFKSANAALAQNDVGIAVAHDDLRRTQQIGHRRHHAALQQNRPARPRRRFQQRVVLHASRADLQNVGVLSHQRDIALRHDLGHNGQAGLVARRGQQSAGLRVRVLEMNRENCAA